MSEAESTLKRYEIPEENFYRVAELVKKLNKRAVKLNQPEMTLNITGEEFRKMTPRNAFYHPEKDNEVLTKVLFVELSGTKPGLNGWEFVASLEHEEGGNIVRTVPGRENDLPKHYRHAGPNCDHCHLARHRKDTYVVYNPETGEYKQIGSTCLRDFTGHKNPHWAAAAAEWLIEIDEVARYAEDFDGGGSRGTAYFNIVDFLTVAVYSIRTEGYSSRSKGIGVPTADRVAEVMFDGKQKSNVFPTPEDEINAKNTIEWAREELTRKVETDDASDFDWNMYRVAVKDAISARQFGYAAYLPVMFKKAFEAEVARKVEKAESNHVGKEGVRSDFGPMTVVSTFETETMYGTSYMNKFVDAEGNVIIWWTGQEFEVGKAYSGKATVKKHSEYRGIKQTEISRAKLQEAA